MENLKTLFFFFFFTELMQIFCCKGPGRQIKKYLGFVLDDFWISLSPISLASGLFLAFAGFPLK